MPIVMKSSNNGMVDPVTKTVRLPGYLGKPHPRAEWLRMAAVAALPWAVWFTSPSRVQAQTPVTLTSTDGYTVAIVDPTSPTVGVPAGLNSLTIANPSIPQVNNQWFYYRLGTSDSGAFSPLQNLGTPVEFQALPNIANLTYSGTYNGNVPFSIAVQYTLTGQGKTGATLGETITISNNAVAGGVLPIDFIQYNNFTLAGDTAHEDITGISAMDIDQVNELNAATIKEHAGVTSANYYEAVTYASSPALTPDFTSPTFTNLDSSDTTAGPGNVVWAFEWENDGANATATIGPSSDLILSKTIGINVPEPASTGLALGAATLFAARRPRRRANVV
jgi:hypothetical protein